MTYTRILTNGAIFAKDIVHLLSCDLIREILHIQDPVHLRRKLQLSTLNNNYHVKGGRTMKEYNKNAYK